MSRSAHCGAVSRSGCNYLKSLRFFLRHRLASESRKIVRLHNFRPTQWGQSALQGCVAHDLAYHVASVSHSAHWWAQPDGG